MRHRNACLLIISACVCLSSVTFAGELIKSEVNDIGDHFVLHLEMRIDADAESVYDVLVDFNNIKYLNDSIKESELLKSVGLVHTVSMRSEGCVLFFCQSVTQVTTVTELDDGYIMSIVDPEQSDLSYGKTLWQVIEEEDETTKIIYNADIVPDFWIPPLIGTHIFKNRLAEEGEKTINGIERIINAEDNTEDD